MKSGEENKVISFTVDRNLIEKVKNKKVVGTDIVNMAKDVWLLPSLRK